MNPETEQTAAEDVRSIGQILRKARESQHLSRDDVAKKLNLNKRQIVSLEQDQYDNLSGNTFVKGYIRSYSGLLNLDPEVLLSRLYLEPELSVDITPKTSIATPTPSFSRARRKKRFRQLAWILATIIVIGLASLYISLRFLEQPGVPILDLFNLNTTSQSPLNPDPEQQSEDVLKQSQSIPIDRLAIPVE